MAILTIKPNFLRNRNIVTLPCDKLNNFATEEVKDNVSYYQNKYGVFSYMKLSSDKEFILTTLKGGHPFMWQPYRICSFDPLGNTINLGQERMTPCKALLQEKFCVDELLGSMFEQFLVIRDNRTELTPEGVTIMNQVIKKLVEQATLGAILTLTVGKLHDADVVEFKEGTPTTVEQAFAKTIGTCRGWLELLKERAAQGSDAAQLNNESLLKLEDFEGSKYIGDPVALFESLVEAGTGDLQSMMNEGGFQTSLGQMASPLYLVSYSIYNNIAQMWRKQCVNPLCVNPRLTAEKTGATMNYFIDGVPVVPLAYVSYLDKYLTGTQHFAAVTVAGNINLGASFGSIPNLGDANVGIAIEKYTDLERAGQYLMQAMSYFSTAIADTNLISATQRYLVA